MADPEKVLREGRNFKEVLQFLKSNWISLAYRIRSDKELFINENCFVFLLYRGLCRFCAIFRRFGGAWPRFAPVDPPFKAMAPHPRLIRICVYTIYDIYEHSIIQKSISPQSISKKCMQILLCMCKLYHRFKQNAPESESRQFGRPRLRLRLLARCHDSGRLQLRLRLRTPGRRRLEKSGHLSLLIDAQSAGSDEGSRFGRGFVTPRAARQAHCILEDRHWSRIPNAI